MTHCLRFVAAAAALSALWCVSVQAQTPSSSSSMPAERPGHGWFNVDVAYQVWDERRSDGEFWPPMELSGGLKLGKQVGVGVGVSRFVQPSHSVPVDCGETNNLVTQRDYLNYNTCSLYGERRRQEEAVIHLNAVGFVPVTDRVSLIVSGGPSVFRVDQKAEGGELRKRVAKLGFNLGADLSVFFSDYVGWGGSVRFARMPRGRYLGQLGGLQVGGGLRFRF